MHKKEACVYEHIFVEVWLLINTNDSCWLCLKGKDFYIIKLLPAQVPSVSLRGPHARLVMNNREGPLSWNPMSVEKEKGGKNSEESGLSYASCKVQCAMFKADFWSITQYTWTRRPVTDVATVSYKTNTCVSQPRGWKWSQILGNRFRVAVERENKWQCAISCMRAFSESSCFKALKVSHHERRWVLLGSLD